MVSNKGIDTARINAKETDAFDIYNLKHYIGPNPYLETAATVFDFALVETNPPLEVEDYVGVIGDRYPSLKEQIYPSHAHLFAQTVLEVSKLDMDLHFSHWSLELHTARTRVAVEALHARTSRAVVYPVWDWFEAITSNKSFWLEDSDRGFAGGVSRLGLRRADSLRLTKNSG